MALECTYPVTWSIIAGNAGNAAQYSTHSANAVASRERAPRLTSRAGIAVKMLSLIVLCFFVVASGVTAHGFDFLDGLPKCWQKTLKATGNGCNSKSCICDASQSKTFLPNVASSILANCDTEDWVLEATFLFPVQAYCDLVGLSVPDTIMSSAYAATATTASPSTTRKVVHSQTTHGYHTTKAVGDLKSTVTTTRTQTTTDKDGSTLEIIIPIVLGPKTLVTGRILTSTLEPEATRTKAPSSIAAWPSITAAPVPASTRAHVVAVPTLISSSSPKTPNSGGSPFDNMQAGASRWSVSGTVLGMGFLAGLLMRLGFNKELDDVLFY
ncbi:hypothetical protein K504DRAFT_493257 [Pleomassaria siparia CBS 279.74]|uniref:Extracellular membrane protein CFEM domain-containing protein n=1 Tax=Pleomassaria siparia CBS 279.74 TaxID=1314801 RepID=A0A6G1K2G3_9PLEO|nr:hypothetical protein K504DRAFT_493257 [Pleomassaria siparia CBS 279.74]